MLIVDLQFFPSVVLSISRFINDLRIVDLRICR